MYACNDPFVEVTTALEVALYSHSLVGEICLAAAGLLPALLLTVALLAASRLSRSLRWILANAAIAALFIQLHFLIRASLRLAALRSDPHFCRVALRPSVTPSSCMLEEAPWTTASFFLAFFPILLCLDRLLCSSVRLQRAKNLGKFGVVLVWLLGWAWAILLILQSNRHKNIHFCHNLFALTQSQRSVALWAGLVTSFATLAAYSFVYHSNSALLRRALNHAIFFPSARIRILDTIAVNRSLFPLVLLHILTFTPLAVAVFAIQVAPPLPSTTPPPPPPPPPLSERAACEERLFHALCTDQPRLLRRPSLCRPLPRHSPGIVQRAAGCST